MNTWGVRSRSVLDTLCPDLALLCDTVLSYHDCSLIWGYRGEDEQNRLFNARPQLSKVEDPLRRHNQKPSSAVDIIPYIHGIGGITGNKPGDLRYFDKFAGVVLGIAHMLYMGGEMKHEITWGGDWDGDHDLSDQTFNDLYHYQLIVPNSVP